MLEPVPPFRNFPVNQLSSELGELRMWNLTHKKPENCTTPRFLEQDSGFTWAIFLLAIAQISQSAQYIKMK